jgi:hypothetical protein
MPEIITIIFSCYSADLNMVDPSRVGEGNVVVKHKMI